MKMKSIVAALVLALGAVGSQAQSFTSGTTGSFSYLVAQGASLTASLTSVMTAAVGFNISSVMFGATPFASSITSFGGSTFEQHSFAASSGSAGNSTVSGAGTIAPGSADTGNVMNGALPEPQTFALLLAGASAVGFLCLRRKKQN